MYDSESRALEGSDRQRRTDNRLIADGGTTWSDLTAFQRDLLFGLAESGEDTHGLGLKEILKRGSYDYETVNHGRLYPNLDTLTELGFVEKGELDRRTNYYALTGAGEELVRDHARHAIDVLRDLDGDAEWDRTQKVRTDGGDA